MTVPRPLFIVNPSTGRLGGANALRRFVGAVENVLGDVDIEATQRSGHAIDLARHGTLDGRDLIVAVGGDGTLNEVVNGVMTARGGGRQPAGPRVGLIGLGTGGDFGRSLGIGRDLDSYLAALVSGHARAVDLVRTSFAGHEGEPIERYVINVVSAGPGGLVDTYVARFPRALGGRLAYAGASLLALVECPRARLRLRWTAPAAPGSPERESEPEPEPHEPPEALEPPDRVQTSELSAYLVALCNGAAFGGGMRLAPMAEPDDGVLDLISIAVSSKVTVVRHLPEVYAGRHLEVPGVEHLRCRSLELELLDEEAAGRFALDVDGEALGRLPLRAEVVPGAIEMPVLAPVP